MAYTNYHPERLLFRSETAGKRLLWNSTDNLYNYNKNKKKIDSYYSESNVVYTFNNMGYRAVDFNELNSSFILCFGCSYTEGLGVSDADTWPARLENVMNTQTVNLGMGGSSTLIQLINATQWINNNYPKPRAVVIQIPEVTRDPRVELKHFEYTKDKEKFDIELSSIYLNGTRENYDPGIKKEIDYYGMWRKYINSFPDSFDATDHSILIQDITPYFITSALVTTFQTMWNNIGVPVLQMTYDDDGDVIYNPANVFRITGDINQDFGRDGAHAGYRTHQALAEAIAPIVDDMITLAKTQRPTSITRQRHDIVRVPQDLTHRTINEARTNLEKFDRKKGSPFIYE
jgi:hypothetical protein